MDKGLLTNAMQLKKKKIIYIFIYLLLVLLFFDAVNAVSFVFLQWLLSHLAAWSSYKSQSLHAELTHLQNDSFHNSITIVMFQVLITWV